MDKNKTADKDTIRQIAREFKSCRKLLVALGDENRQHLILEMMQMGDCSGVRVVDVAEKSHLSRPAVSHHIQILKDAGILKRRKEGTKNYYYFDEDTEALNRLLTMIGHAKAVMQALPAGRNGDD